MSAVATLPRGRHGLSREHVANAQRERIQRALADAVATRGYAATSVADVLRAARVSRATFYEQFASKEDCFMSVFEEAYERLSAAAAAEPVGEGDPFERLEGALGAYLEALAADPAYARVFLVEVHAAGPAALRRRAELQRGLVDLLARTLGVDGDRRFAVEALVAATTALVTTRLIDCDHDGVRELRAPLAALARRTWGRS